MRDDQSVALLILSESSTLIAALVDALQRAGSYNRDDQTPPAAILWPDGERQWAPLLPELRQRLPLLTLGPYAPAERTGPAYYLRCMIGRTLPDDLLPADAVPIVYLPGVSRQELRAIEECPRALQPLAELQYRGVLWAHKNGRDWTVAGFLQNTEGGLGIPVGADSATREALLRALPVLAREPLAHLRKEAPLRAPFLDALLNPDEVRRLLLWMNDPKGYSAQAGPAEWAAFCNLCSHKYSFHPQHDGELAAGERLGQPKGEWETVWQRFTEAPDACPGLPDLLHRARPKQRTLFEEASPYWPQDCEIAESALREGLLSLRDRLPAQARTALSELEAKHGNRRDWVWARLGLAPLAVALEHLMRLAKATETPLGGASVSAIANAYSDWGWQADAAVLDALAAVEGNEDVAAVKAAIPPLYRPWLEAAATAFQQAILGNPIQNYQAKGPGRATAGTCIVFSDALRFDAARRLIAALEERGFECESHWSLAALPPVTSTAKPAVAPIADKISGGAPGLTPVVTASGAALNVNALRKLLEEAGYQVLMGEETGDPTGIAWTEIGAIDQYGHVHGGKIAVHLGAELLSLEGRIVALLGAGWKSVLVITDHGWLLMPGGLPKAELPQHLTLERKGRCAAMKEGAQTDQATVPWHWDHNVSIAVAPGIACYEAGKEYEHGGLSPQECVVPVITITSGGGSELQAVGIKLILWKGLRCQVELTGAQPGVVVDIRTKAGDATTSLVEKPKPPNPDGAVSLPVPDDAHMGEAAVVVVLAEDETLLAQTLTTVGG